jgi:hypothetical protein
VAGPGWRAGGRSLSRAAGDGQGVGGIGLAGAAQPSAFPDRQRTRHLAHVNTLVVQKARQGGTEVGAAFHSHPGDRPVLGEPASESAVAGWGVGEAGRGQAAAGLVDQAGRQGVLMAVDPAEHWTTSVWSGDDGPAARRHASG